jgi:hypothetical protein
MINFSTRKVGGLRIVKLGRLTLSFSVAAKGTPFVPIKGSRAFWPWPLPAPKPPIIPPPRTRGIPVYCVGEQA